VATHGISALGDPFPQDARNKLNLPLIYEHLEGKVHTFQKVDGKLYLWLPEEGDAALRAAGIGTTNVEKAHITVINSNVYKEEIHGKLDGVQTSDVHYGCLQSTPVYDYPYFISAMVVCVTCPLATEIAGKESFHWSLDPQERLPKRLESIFC